MLKSFHERRRRPHVHSMDSGRRNDTVGVATAE